MRAIQLAKTGGPEVLGVSEVDRPSAGEGEVLIEVAAAGVNFIDTYLRGGLYPLDLPAILGLECSGTVVEVGAGVANHAVGDRVAVGEGGGSYAEFRTADANRVVAVPDAVSFDHAAAAMIQGLTAHYLAVDTYPLAPGDRCLIHAAAGGTGRLLVQLAKAAGAEVFATVGSAAKAELAASAGADHIINYSEKDFAVEIRSISGEDKPLDVVYDGVGAAVFEQSMDLLRVRGLMATFGNASGAVPPVSPLDLMRGGSLFLTRPTLFNYISTPEELNARASAVFDLIASGDLDIRIDTTFPLDQARAAHEHLEARKSTGKLLLTP